MLLTKKQINKQTNRSNLEYNTPSPYRGRGNKYQLKDKINIKILNKKI